MNGNRGRQAARIGAVAVVASAQILLLVGSASATVGQVELVGSVLKYEAGAANNVVTVSQGSGTVIFDDAVIITPGPHCWWGSSDHTKVTCDSSGVTGIKVTGGDGNDRINSTTQLPVTLWGGNGNDILSGGAGDDILRGDAGDDVMHGDGGRDGVTYYGYDSDVSADLDGVDGDDGGANENDTIGTDVEDLYGGDRNDKLTGNGEENLLSGNGGNDVLRGYGANDTIYGSDGADSIYAGFGNDTVSAGNGADLVYGDVGNDVLNGGTGDDRLLGEEGVDSLFGDDDDDQLWGGLDPDVLNGGSGGDECFDSTVLAQISCE